MEEESLIKFPNYKDVYDFLETSLGDRYNNEFANQLISGLIDQGLSQEEMIREISARARFAERKIQATTGWKEE